MKFCKNCQKFSKPAAAAALVQLQLQLIITAVSTALHGSHHTIVRTVYPVDLLSAVASA